MNDLLDKIAHETSEMSTMATNIDIIPILPRFALINLITRFNISF